MVRAGTHFQRKWDMVVNKANDPLTRPLEACPCVVAEIKKSPARQGSLWTVCGRAAGGRATCTAHTMTISQYSFQACTLLTQAVLLASVL